MKSRLNHGPRSNNTESDMESTSSHKYGGGKLILAMHVPWEPSFIVAISDASDSFALSDAGALIESFAFECGNAGDVIIQLRKRIAPER